MRRVRVVLNAERPLMRDVMRYILADAGMEVAGESSDPVTLLCSIHHLRPEAVFLWTNDASCEPGICSHILYEYPHLKVIVISPECYTIHDVSRVRHFSDPSMSALHVSVLESFID